MPPRKRLADLDGRRTPRENPRGEKEHVMGRTIMMAAHDEEGGAGDAVFTGTDSEQWGRGGTWR